MSAGTEQVPASTTSTDEQVASGRSRTQAHPLTVTDLEQLTDDAVAITFGVPEGLHERFSWKAGQHLTLVAEVDGEEVRRSYSICSPPSSGRLRIAVKRLEGGLFSGHALSSVSVGDTMRVMEPAGRFGTDVDPSRERHVVLVAAGSGVTPIMAILGAVLEGEPLSTATLVYGNRVSGSVMFTEEISDWKDRYPARLQVVHVLSREAHDAELLHGRIDEVKLRTLLGTLIPPETVDDWYLCGPFAMVQQVHRTLLEEGVDKHAVHLELFHVDGEQPRMSRNTDDGQAPACEVTVRLDGRSSTFAMPDEGSVLDATLAVRADAPFACKGGVCGTCRSKVVEGEVEMTRNYALEPAEIEAGYVLACQSVPTTPRLVVDFDA